MWHFKINANINSCEIEYAGYGNKVIFMCAHNLNKTAKITKQA